MSEIHQKEHSVKDGQEEKNKDGQEWTGLYFSYGFFMKLFSLWKKKAKKYINAVKSVKCNPNIKHLYARAHFSLSGFF